MLLRRYQIILIIYIVLLKVNNILNADKDFQNSKSQSAEPCLNIK